MNETELGVFNFFVDLADEGISSSPKSRLSNEETSMEAIMKTQDVETYSTPNYYYEHHHHHPNSSSSSSSKSHKFEADQKSIFSMSTNLPISTGFFFLSLFSFFLLFIKRKLWAIVCISNYKQKIRFLWAYIYMGLSKKMIF